MVIKVRLGNPHMGEGGGGRNCIEVSSMYTIRETQGEKPGLVRMAGHFSGT
jgi:hypothetical protein